MGGYAVRFNRLFQLAYLVFDSTSPLFYDMVAKLVTL